MGVAGCGKSAVGQLIAQHLELPYIEGDDFHPPANIGKMKQGVPLNDDDRAGWLDALVDELVGAPAGAVLGCSALKRDYREKLRRAVPALCFVYLAITPEQSLQRVRQRPGHFYPPSLVASQFADLEDPTGETGVLTLAGDAALEPLALQAACWLLPSLP